MNRLFVLGIHGRRGGDVYQKFLELCRTSRLSQTQLSNIQEKKFRGLLKHAQNKTNFYKNAAYAKTFPNGTPLRDYLADLPILNKTTIKQAGNDFFDTDIKKIHFSQTGGTTGQPLAIRKCDEGVNWALAALWRGRKFAGVNPKDRGLWFMTCGEPTLKGRIKMRLLRKHMFGAFSNDTKAKHRIASLLSRRSVTFIEGFVSGIQHHAENLGQPAGLKSVLTTGEMLYSHMRFEIQEKLGAKVFSYYGSNEIGGIAFECEHQNLHVTDEHVLLETVDDAGNPVWERPGRVLVTDLDNKAMPLIRYELGDIATLTKEPCPCGRELTCIRELIGRNHDYISNPSGKKLPITYFEGKFRNLRDIGKVQIIQISDGSVQVLYTGITEKAPIEADYLCKEISKELGEDIDVTIEHSENLFITERGKTPLIRRMSE